MEEGTGILKCKGRIQGYQPTYLEGGMFVEKLVRYTHEQVLHLGIANTMSWNYELSIPATRVRFSEPNRMVLHQLP